MGEIITAIILAGGKGERLKPLTDRIPKPMLKVDGKPILEHIVNLLTKNNITDIIISICYKPNNIKRYFKSGKKFGVNIRYVQEKENKPLGTAGAIAFLKSKIQQTFIVTYGDILRELDIKKLLDFHKKNNGIGTICVYENKNPNPKSLITFNKNYKITKFIERPKNVRNNKVWSNGSFYVFEPEIFNYLPYNKKADFGKDIFPNALTDNKKLVAFLVKGYFLDIGDLKKLDQAKKDWKIYAS